MSFLEKLQSIVKFDIDLSKLKNLTVKLISDNSLKDLIHIEDHSKTVNININALPEDTIPQVKALIRETVVTA